MIGIYKITSPSGRVYVGQSVDVENRFKDYSNLQNCKNQRKLYNSLKKYLPENHIFEVIEECELNVLNEREGYWQDYFNSVITGLNCRRVKSSDKSGYLSQETKDKVAMARKNTKASVETKTKMSLSKTGDKNPMFGKKLSEESKDKISKTLKSLYTNSSKHGRLEKILSNETKMLLSEANTRGNHPKSKKVVDTITGKIFDCAKDAAEAFGLKYTTLLSKLNLNRKNNTTLKFC